MSLNPFENRVTFELAMLQERRPDWLCLNPFENRVTFEQKKESSKTSFSV